MVWLWSAGRYGAAAEDISKTSTFEYRKKMREQRRKEMQSLLEEKPSEDAADPRDLEAINNAETKMGDYKLKSSPSYEVISPYQ